MIFFFRRFFFFWRGRRSERGRSRSSTERVARAAAARGRKREKVGSRPQASSHGASPRKRSFASDRHAEALRGSRGDVKTERRARRRLRGERSFDPTLSIGQRRRRSRRASFDSSLARSFSSPFELERDSGKHRMMSWLIDAGDQEQCEGPGRERKQESRSLDAADGGSFFVNCINAGVPCSFSLSQRQQHLRVRHCRILMRLIWSSTGFFSKSWLPKKEIEKAESFEEGRKVGRRCERAKGREREKKRTRLPCRSH